MSKESITICIPTELLEQAQQLKTGSESFDEMIEQALGTEIKRRKALVAHQKIVACSAEIESQTGIQPSSLHLIHQFREGEERHG